jgi:LysR family transcriptional activator of mexEF-oprN operon
MSFIQSTQCEFESILWRAMSHALARLREQAPGVHVKAQLMEVDQLLPALDEDSVDLVVVAVELPLRTWHQRAPLMSSRFNCLYSPAQLSLGRPLSLTALATLDHVVSSYRGDAASVVDQVFAAQGLSRHVVASSTSMMAVLLMQVVPLRTSPPMVITFDMVWHSRYQQQPLHSYVREQILAITSSLQPKRPRLT